MAEQQTQAVALDEKPLWLIKQVAIFLVWLETLLVTVSSLMLTFVAVLTVASALNGGKLLEDNQTLNALYSWCQGLGIEGQLSGMTFQAVRAAKRGQSGQAIWYWVITLVLAGASIMAIGAVNYQQTFNVSFAQALATVGISQFLWVWLRAVILVVLLILAAAMRYQPGTMETTDEKIRKIQDNARIAAARTESLKQGLGGLAAGVRGALAKPASAAAGGDAAPLA